MRLWRKFGGGNAPGNFYDMSYPVRDIATKIALRSELEFNLLHIIYEMRFTYKKTHLNAL